MALATTIMTGPLLSLIGVSPADQRSVNSPRQPKPRSISNQRGELGADRWSAAMPFSLAGDLEEVGLGWAVVELAVVGGRSVRADRSTSR